MHLMATARSRTTLDHGCVLVLACKRYSVRGWDRYHGRYQCCVMGDSAGAYCAIVYISLQLYRAVSSAQAQSLKASCQVPSQQVSSRIMKHAAYALCAKRYAHPCTPH